MLMTKKRHEEILSAWRRQADLAGNTITSLCTQVEAQREGVERATRSVQDADARIAALQAKLDRYAATVRVGDRRIATRSGSEVEVVSVTDRHNDPDGKLSVGVRFINPFDPQKPHRWFTYSRVRGWALA